MRHDLQTAFDASRGGMRFRNCPKLEDVESVLSSDEEVIQLLQCQIGTKAAIVVLTNKHIYLVSRGNVIGNLAAANEIVPFSQITGIDRKRVPMNEWGITLTRASNIDQLIFCDEAESAKFVAKARDLISEVKSGSGTIVQNQLDPLDQIRKLKELLDAGILSQAEFDEKKQSLMDKI